MSLFNRSGYYSKSDELLHLRPTRLSNNCAASLTITNSSAKISCWRPRKALKHSRASNLHEAVTCSKLDGSANQKTQARSEYLIGRLPTLPHTCACSTIGAERLNFRVRDGNGWDPLARITRNLYYKISVEKRIE